MYRKSSSFPSDLLKPENFQELTMRVEMLFAAGILVLSFTAEKCRQLVGEESSSRSWTDRFTFLNCFDMRYGTIACITKECIKLYLYYIRAVHVHKVRAEATEAAMREQLSKDESFEDGVKRAREAGNAAARRASRQANHIMGPVVSSGWDFFEALYVGGTLSEGIVRAAGTFVCAYAGGIVGEGKFGWFGFMVGSQLGSWFGGRLGLMVYDVGKGVKYLLRLFHN